jgi:lysophospholipase L1-like esterase
MLAQRTSMDRRDKALAAMQRRYLAGLAAIAPVSPFLFLQGQIARWKIGLLPVAGGERKGVAGTGEPLSKLLVIGESTVAGLGARTHEFALAGQFARCLGSHIGRAVEWHVVGRNGVTARRTIDELLPLVPAEEFDYVLLGIGGNDVMRLSSPVKWRRDMLELIGRLRELARRAVIFISNCPMIGVSPAIPQPVKRILWELSKMHNENIKQFTRDMDRVFYYPQPANVPLEGFFADGIHPSEQGYADWAEAMLDHFAENYQW